LFAQTNGVAISNFAVDAGTVTFEVSWNKADMPSIWSDSVWVFVDYNDNGTMKRLPLTGAALLESSAPGYGRVIEVPGNTSGMWVAGNARSTVSGSFWAKVQLYTTENVVGGACVYASNYPPVGRFTTGSDIAFTGTPMYNITFKRTDGTTYTLSSRDNMPVLPTDTLLSFVDATGAPGIIVSHVKYCFDYNPGKIVGDGEIVVDPVCGVYYSAGAIGGDGDMLPVCVSYAAGVVGGLDDAPPGCATYRAGSVGGLPFVGAPNCGGYVAGLIVGAGDDVVPLACAGYYNAGAIGGKGDMLPVCARYIPGVVGGADDAAPGCATYRAGSVGGLPFEGWPL
jgi:hypothetical protein